MAAPSGTFGQVLGDAAAKLGEISGWANSALSNAQSAISSLGSFSTPNLPAAPVSPTMSTVGSVSTSYTPPKAPVPQSISINTLRDIASVSEDIAPGEAPDWKTFGDQLPVISIPEAPNPIDTTGMPAKPGNLADVVLPDAPVYAEPSLGSLQPITIPSFTFPVLPVFDATAPEFINSPPSTVMQWHEAVYASENLDDVRAVVKRMLAGGTGINADVEQAMFDRARSREDQITQKAIQDAFDAFASRGFDMPPGMLAAQVDAALQDGNMRLSAVNRDILIEAAKWEIENMRFAVQQGIALEQLLVNLFNNVAQRAFEVAKLKVESDLQLYNMSVNVFNAEMQAYQTRANVFKTELEGELAKVDVYKAELEGQKLIGEINQQTVQVFLAQYEAVKARVEVYRAMMSGAQVQAETNRLLIDGYKADIEAYATKLNAEKVRFDAYDAQVKAEASKASIVSSMAQTFGALVQSYAAGEEVKVKNQQARIEVMKADVARFSAEAEMEKTRLMALAQKTDAEVRVYTADASAQSEYNRAQAAVSQMNISVAELNAQNNFHKYAADAKVWEATVQAMVQEAGILQHSLAAAAQASASLAAGAMSAAHVSISEQVGATTSENYSWSGQIGGTT